MEKPAPSSESRVPKHGGEPEESVTKASVLEIFGSLTLTNPTWTILRHPFRFDRYRANAGASIHYLYAAIGTVLVLTKWTSTEADNNGGDAAPILALINGALARIGPNAKVDGSDGIAVMLLLFNLVAGVTAYASCRLLSRNSLPSDAIPPANLPAQTMAATAYLGGACSVIFALKILMSGDQAQGPLPTIFVSLLFFLIYCWGYWLRTIHGIRRGRLFAALFPFAISFASLAICAAVAELIKLALG